MAADLSTRGPLASSDGAGVEEKVKRPGERDRLKSSESAEICFTGAVIYALTALALAVLYAYILWRDLDAPGTFTHLSNGIGALVFSVAASAIWFLALGVNHDRHRVETRERRLTFFGAIWLLLILWIVGMQFLVVGEWRLISPAHYNQIRYAAYFGLHGYLLFAWRRLRAQR